MIRARTVIIQDRHIALMRRERVPGRVYYMVPGGGVEDGETPEQAAVREAFEEVGLHVRIDRLLLIARFGQDDHYCYLAHVAGGTFGTGAGPEFTERSAEMHGTYAPVWLALDQVGGLDVRPGPIAAAIIDGTLFDDGPVRIVDDLRRDAGADR